MRECCCPSGPAGKHQEESPKRMSLRGPCGAQLPDRKSEARSPSGGPAGHHQQVEVRSAVTLSAGYPEALVPPGALRGETTRRRSEARSPSGGPAGHHCRALATSNSLLHSLFQHLCYSLLQRLRLAVGAFPTRLWRAHSLRAGPRTSPERCAALPARSQCVAQRVRPRGAQKRERGGDRSLSGAPPARAQSARGSADVSGTMRRASGALTACCTACTAAGDPKRDPWVVHRSN